MVEVSLPLRIRIEYIFLVLLFYFILLSLNLDLISYSDRGLYLGLWIGDACGLNSTACLMLRGKRVETTLN